MIKLTGRIRVLKVKAEEGRDTRVIMACLVSCTIRFVGFVFGQEHSGCWICLTTNLNGTILLDIELKHSRVCYRIRVYRFRNWAAFLDTRSTKRQWRLFAVKLENESIFFWQSSPPRRSIRLQMEYELHFLFTVSSTSPRESLSWYYSIFTSSNGSVNLLLPLLFRHNTTCIATVICDNAAFLWLTFCTSRRASKRDNARREDSRNLWN